MAKKPTPAHFSSVLDDETPAPATATGKKEQLSFPIDSDTKKRLARAVYHKGIRTTQREYLAKMLKDALDKDPDADKPAPGE